MLNINGLDIANTELSKLLGVHIDDNLNFTEHIYFNSKNYVLRQAKKSEYSLVFET